MFYEKPIFFESNRVFRVYTGGKLIGQFTGVASEDGFYPEEWKDPLKTEKIMTELISPEEQSDFCHRIVLFGRDICTARSPKCGECPLAIHCKYMNG